MAIDSIPPQDSPLPPSAASAVLRRCTLLNNQVADDFGVLTARGTGSFLLEETVIEGIPEGSSAGNGVLLETADAMLFSDAAIPAAVVNGGPAAPLSAAAPGAFADESEPAFVALRTVRCFAQAAVLCVLQRRHVCPVCSDVHGSVLCALQPRWFASTPSFPLWPQTCDDILELCQGDAPPPRGVAFSYLLSYKCASSNASGRRRLDVLDCGNGSRERSLVQEAIAAADAAMGSAGVSLPPAAPGGAMMEPQADAPGGAPSAAPDGVARVGADLLWALLVGALLA